MAIISAPVWGVNELNEIVVQSGSGTSTVTGFVPQNEIATDPASNKVVMKLPDLTTIVLGELLTGFVSGAGTVAATDTILQAFNKIVGNVALKATNLLTGFVSGSGTVAATDTVLQGINKLDGNIGLKANAANSVLTGVTSTQAVVRNTRVVIAAGAVTVSATDDIIVVNKTSGASTVVNLPTGVLGRTLVIKDGKADASTNNITVTPAAGNIDGAATYVMNIDKQAVTVVFDGNQWEII